MTPENKALFKGLTGVILIVSIIAVIDIFVLK